MSACGSAPCGSPSTERAGRRSVRRRLGAWTPRALLLAPLIGCGGGEPQRAAQELRPVRYAEAFAAGSQTARTFAGVARAASEQGLAFRVAGTLVAVEVDVGSQVRRGQVLARLDPGDLELRRQVSAAGVAQARAQARNAHAGYERAVGLFESGSASMADLDAARAAYESAGASELSATTALRLAEQQVAYTRLLAPVDGSVKRIAVEVNEAVAAGQTVLVVIDTGGGLEVHVTVPESFIGGLARGRPAQVVFGAVGGAELEASVTEVGSAATGAGGFPVVVRLDEGGAGTRIRPGMAAEVTFAIESPAATGVLVAPRAVAQDRRGRFVYVLLPSGDDGAATVERREVETGALTPGGLEIVSGVAAGEYVATAGLRTLASGQRVRLLESEPTR